MSSKQDSAKFFVVGGPVQPNRSCYITREADAALYARVVDGEYCRLLAPRHMGKTSLIARTARRLRADGVRVAILDLSFIRRFFFVPSRAGLASLGLALETADSMDERRVPPFSRILIS